MTEKLRVYLKEKATTREKREKYFKICLEKHICPNCGEKLNNERYFPLIGKYSLKCEKCYKSFMIWK
jgi:hypothetical protein